MATDFMTRLPSELWLEIIGCLDLADLKALSSVNTSFRTLTFSRLFRHLKFSTDTTDFEAIQVFLTKYGHNVTKVHYDCNLYPKDSEDEEVLPMPLLMQNILAGEALPDLKVIELEFHPEEDFNGYEADWSPDCDGSIYIHQDLEGTTEIDQAESEYQWRANIKSTFDAVSKNKRLKHLEVYNLIPRECSVWRTETWYSFLSELTTFKLSFWGGDNGAGWHSMVEQGYGEFVETMRHNFFDHMTGLQSLYLASEPSNAIGCEGINHTPLPISRLPSLEKLELENCYIDPALIDLLSTRKEDIRSVRLIGCWAVGDDGLAENAISWATFFRSMRDMQPKNLTEFRIIDTTKILLHYTENDTLKPQMHRDQRIEFENIRRRLKEDNLRLFGYALTDDKYGYLSQRGTDTKDAYYEGLDQEEYDKLMVLVEYNKKRLVIENGSNGAYDADD